MTAFENKNLAKKIEAMLPTEVVVAEKWTDDGIEEISSHVDTYGLYLCFDDGTEEYCDCGWVWELLYKAEEVLDESDEALVGMEIRCGYLDDEERGHEFSDFDKIAIYQNGEWLK